MSDQALMRFLSARKPSELAAWEQQLVRRVEDHAGLGPNFVIVDREHRVRIVIRDFVVVTVLPWCPR